MKILSEQEQVKEMLRCKQDFVYFIEHYAYVDDGAGHNLLKLADKQKDMANALVNDHNVLILGSRQTGKTTLMVCYCAWAMLFFPAISITFISRKEDQAKKQMTDIAILFEHLPEFMRPTLNPDQTTIKTIVENGSTISIESVLTNPDGKGRGMRSHIVWIDEASFLKTLDPLLAALIPTTAQRFLMAKKNGFPYGVVMTTTPNGIKGVGRPFHELWEEAMDAQKAFEQSGDPKELEESFFRPFKIKWNDLPFYDEIWYEGEKKKFGKSRVRKFHQEYDLLFLGTEDTFFPDEILQKFRSVPSIRRQGKIWIFKEFDPTRTYIIATDVATAFGECNSCIEVIDSETLEQVAEFVDKLPIGPPAEYCLLNVMKDVAQLYPKGPVSFEHNGVGNNLVEKLPYVPELKDRLYYEDSKKKKPGFNTTGSSREDMFDTINSVIYADPSLVKSSRLINELIALITDSKGRVGKGRNETDDAVLALGQAYVISVRLKLAGSAAIGGETVITEKEMEDIAFALKLNVKKKNNAFGKGNPFSEMPGYYDPTSMFKSPKKDW